MAFAVFWSDVLLYQVRTKRNVVLIVLVATVHTQFLAGAVHYSHQHCMQYSSYKVESRLGTKLYTSQSVELNVATCTSISSTSLSIGHLT